MDIGLWYKTLHTLNIGVLYKKLCALNLGERYRICAHCILVCGIEIVRIEYWCMGHALNIGIAHYGSGAC
jgi:hypothetical protein